MVQKKKKIHMPVQEMQKTQVLSLGQEDSLEEMTTSPIFLPGESHGQRSLEGSSPSPTELVWEDRAQSSM